MSHDTQTTTNSDTGHGDLAELVSAVMRHPETPNELYNSIGDWLNDSFHDGLQVSEPWFVARALQNAGAESETPAEAPDATPDAADYLETRAAVLTPEEARALCEDFAFRHGGGAEDESDIADLLLLLTAVAFKREMDDREGLLLAARAAFMPYIGAAVGAVDALIAGRLEAWRR
jgi:hypothetical protein